MCKGLRVFLDSTTYVSSTAVAVKAYYLLSYGCTPVLLRVTTSIAQQQWDTDTLHDSSYSLCHQTLRHILPVYQAQLVHGILEKLLGRELVGLGK